MPLVAGVDSSTQSCKIVIRDADTGALVRSGRAAHPEGTEIDPGEWWKALQEAVADAGGLEDVAAISIAAQQHGMVALDAAGRIIRPALLWHDTRSAPAALELAGEVGEAEYVQRTGVLPVASFTVTKLRWLRDAEPHHAANVAAVALPHDWLTWRLRGYGPTDTEGVTAATTNPLGPVLTELTTDRSDASGTGYWSPHTNAYDFDLFERALGHSAVLPRVLSEFEQAGKTVALNHRGVEWVPAGITVGVGAGDNAGAALGLGARAGDVVVSIGTSGTVFAVTPHPVADATGAVAGFASASGEYLPLVATLNAARVLDSIAGLLGVDYDTLGALAEQAEPGAAGLVLQPYFAGERTPNLPNATASVFGMTLPSTTRPNLARAAIEGMLCGLADGLDAIRSQDVRVQRILLIGGAAQNSAVRSIAAQVFNAPVTVPSPGEYVADGAAMQAAWAHTGNRPLWQAAIAAAPAPNYNPVIRAQYAAHAQT